MSTTERKFLDHGARVSVRADREEQQASGAREQRTQAKAREKERIQAFEKEIQREEQEALKNFKEGLRRAVGAG